MSDAISESFYIDTHCHLHLLDNPSDKVNEAHSVGIGTILNIFDPTEKNFEENLEYLSQNPNVYFSVGVHPLSVEKIGEETFYEIFDQANEKYTNLIACGETGIDLYYGRNFDIQLPFLRVHIEVCKKYKKILVIHCRSCDVDTILDEIPSGIMFIFHSFTMGKEQMEKIVKRGGFVSYSGIITFNKNVSDIHSALRNTPLENLFLETDSPYLTPSPYRKYKNEPKYVIEVYKKAALIMNKPIEEIIKAVQKNFSLLKNFALK
jgi:TatD DNase family protein